MAWLFIIPKLESTIQKTNIIVNLIIVTWRLLAQVGTYTGFQIYHCAQIPYPTHWATKKKQCVIKGGENAVAFPEKAKRFAFNPDKRKFYATLGISFTQDWGTCSRKGFSVIPKSQSCIKTPTLDHEDCTLQINSV